MTMTNIKQGSKGYDAACGAVVLDILIALPLRFAAILISVAFLIFGSFKKKYNY